MDGTSQFIGCIAYLFLSILALGVEATPGHVTIQLKVLQYSNPDGMSYVRSDLKSSRKCCDIVNKVSCGSLKDTCDNYFLFGIGRMERNGFNGKQADTKAHTLADKNSFSYSQQQHLISYLTFDNWQEATTLLINVWDTDGNGRDLIDNMTSLIGGLAIGWNQGSAPKHRLSFQNYVSLTLEIQIWCKDGYYGTSCDRMCTADKFHRCTHDGKTPLSPSCMRKNVLVLRGQLQTRDRAILQDEIENLILQIVCPPRTSNVTVLILEIDMNSYIAFNAECGGRSVDVLRFQMMYLVTLRVNTLKNKFMALVPSMQITDTFYQDKTKLTPFKQGKNFLMLLRVNGFAKKSDPSCASNICTYVISLCILRECSRSNEWLTFTVKQGNSSIINCRGHLIDPTIPNPVDGSAATYFLKLDEMPNLIRVKVRDGNDHSKEWTFNQTLSSSYSPSLQYNLADTEKVILLHHDISMELELAIWCASYSTHAVQECRSSANICLPGYTGSHCTDDINECQVANPCHNGGGCINTPGMFKCKCPHTWTGPTCMKDVNECLIGTCLNATKCTNSPGSFHCECTVGFNGTTCQDIDECLNAPCKNGGTCLNTLGSYTCRCPYGFTGPNCEADIDECQDKVCSYHSLNCTNSFGSFTCNCKNGWEGKYCQKDTNECLKMPCKHGGHCKNLPGDFHCSCSSGWNGTLCDQDIDECKADEFPCKNGGKCLNSDGDFNCSCPIAWTGKTCSMDFDECTYNPCNNSGVCYNFDGGYNCSCAKGWKGMNCNDDVNECENSPCQNNGTCSNKMGGYLCRCKQGWEGTDCEQDIDECKHSPCMNEASCQNTNGSYSCLCRSGWFGYNCTEDINECKLNPCLNGGNCTNTAGSYLCYCSTGWQGENCSKDVDECSLNKCRNNGTCANFVGSFNCSCTTGWTGSVCADDVNECKNDPCLNGGNCTNSIGTYSCKCSSGWQGKNCSEDVDECSINQCHNNGTCENFEGGFNCSCATGWTGSVCTDDVNECEGNVCQNYATCINSNGSYSCICTGGWSGFNCETDINECIVNPCKNQATCHNNKGSFVCECLDGWTGTYCENDIDECLLMPCLNGGTCTNYDGYYKCSCIEQWEGKNCSKDFDECTTKPCFHNGNCTNAFGGFTCDCPSEWSGKDCSVDVNECISSPCLNNGSCLNEDGGYKCSCSKAWYGSKCEFDQDECTSNPCSHGICANTIGSYNCNCPATWTGIDCSEDVNECESNPCLNNGRCVNSPGNYTCSCSAGWTGVNCSDDFNECLSKPCKNGASCLNLEGSYACNCLPRWTGFNCLTQISTPSTTKTTLHYSTSMPLDSTVHTFETMQPNPIDRSTSVMRDYTNTITESIPVDTSTQVIHTDSTDTSQVASISTETENTTPRVRNTHTTTTISWYSDQTNPTINRLTATQRVSSESNSYLSKTKSTRSHSTENPVSTSSTTTDLQTTEDIFQTSESEHFTKGITQGTNKELTIENKHTASVGLQKTTVTVQSTETMIQTIQSVTHTPTTQRNSAIYTTKTKTTTRAQTTSNHRHMSTNPFVRYSPRSSSISFQMTTSRQLNTEPTSLSAGANQSMSMTTKHGIVQPEVHLVNKTTTLMPTSRQSSMLIATDSATPFKSSTEVKQNVAEITTQALNTSSGSSSIGSNNTRSTSPMTHSISYENTVTKVFNKTRLDTKSENSVLPSTTELARASASERGQADTSSVKLPVSLPPSPSTLNTEINVDLRDTGQSKLQSSNNLPLIAGSGGGGAVVLIVIIIVVVRCRRNRSLNKDNNLSTMVQGHEDTQKTVVTVNPLYDVYGSDKATDHYC